MPRRRQTVHLSVTIPSDHHARLVELADDAGVSLADVIRELVAFATKSRSKSDEIRSRLPVDTDRDAS